MVDMYTEKVSAVFQHRWVPAALQSSYSNFRAFLSNYTQSERVRQ
jgi:hypothetical protein